MGFCMVMWTVFFIVKVNFVASIYFTISDVKLTIPKSLSDLSVSSSISQFPIMELNARNTIEEVARTSYSLNSTGGYLYIDENSGRVFLTPAFLRNIKEIGEIDIAAHVHDVDSGDNDRTSLRVTVSPQDMWDCDRFAEEICFWSGAVYRVERRSKAAIMGPLSSALLRGVCPYRVNYTLLTDMNFLEVIPPDEKIPFWYLRSHHSFAETKKSKISVHLLCTLENTGGKERGTIREIETNLTLLLLNINEFAPTPQYPEMNITLSRTIFKKIQIVAVPFLAAMIVLYVVVGNKTIQTTTEMIEPQDYCDPEHPTLIAGIVKVAFFDVPHMLDIIFICNGGVIGMDIVVTSTECFRVTHASDVKKNFKVTTESRLWSRDNNIHSIERYLPLSEDTDLSRLAILQIKPPIKNPNCITDRPISLDPEHVGALLYLGWDFPGTLSTELSEEKESAKESCIFSHGALILTKERNLVGFQTKGCSDSSDIIKFSLQLFENFMKIFPNISISGDAGNENKRYNFLDFGDHDEKQKTIPKNNEMIQESEDS